MFKRGLFVGLILILLQSCQATNKAMIGEKSSETKDEFFIEKKNPLSMPPDFNELPEPSDNKDISLGFLLNVFCSAAFGCYRQMCTL